MLRPMRLCRCGHIHREPRCPKCVQAYERSRGTARQRGYDSSWAAFSRDWRARHPWCGEREDGRLYAEHSLCVQEGRREPAQCVDHIVPHKGDKVKFWAGPFQSLCLRCNNRKRALEEGGFGR